MSTSQDSWVPDECTLPTAEQPLRVAEFDALFSQHLHGVNRLEPTRLRVLLSGNPTADALARDLTARETDCCSFFHFDFLRTRSGRLAMEISVPEGHVAVLDALTQRIASYR